MTKKGCLHKSQMGHRVHLQYLPVLAAGKLNGSMPLSWLAVKSNANIAQPPLLKSS